MASGWLRGLAGRPLQRERRKAARSILARASGGLWKGIACLWQSLPTDVLPALSVSAAGSRTCAVDRETGALICWEETDASEYDVPSELGPVLSVSAGTGHFCTLTALGQVLCFGANDHLQCSVPADLGKVVSVAVGDLHTCVVRHTGQLVCFGWNGCGQCDVPKGLGSVVSVSAGAQHTCAVTSTGKLVCFGGTDEVGQCRIPPDLGPVTFVSASGLHTCALAADLRLKCFGWNGHGQCNVPADLGPVAVVAAGGLHTCAITVRARLVCFGWNEYGQCDVPEDLGPVVSVAAGGGHTCALTVSGQLVCFGLAPQVATKSKGVESLSTARADAQLDLAQAMEDHDESRLRRALAVAENLEVAPEEIAAARRMLEFEVNKVLLADAKQMRSSIRQLAQRVAQAELRKPEVQAPAAPPRFSKLAELLEKRVWSSLEPKISSIVSSAVAKATARMDKAEGSGRPSPAVTFEDIDTDKDGFISREEFAAAQKKGLLSSGPLCPKPATAPPCAAPAPSPPAQEVSHRSIVRQALFTAMQGAAKRLVEKKEFGELDTDGDGIVSQKELDSALVDMNVEGTDAEQAKQEILQHVDKDGDGIISRAEFQSAKADVSKESAQTDAANEQSEKKLVVRSILSSSYSDAAKRLLQAKNFQQMDQDGDGRVTEQEVSAALASMEVHGQEAVQATAELMQQVDKDGDGTISQEELKQAKAEAAEPTPSSEPQSLTRSVLALTYSDIAKRLLEEKTFKELDKDGDGAVTKEELDASLAEMNLNSEEAAKANKEIMEMVDKDGDGVISNVELSQAKAEMASTAA
ncbi:CML12 [Symbiodinium natans]|uniref:CML12 protein n=1 Tax=Symbiodinium natans TaxID=878477 RepID=A0A812RSA8_9DINO|nr:CML12 [Symbiodinium natans]